MSATNKGAVLGRLGDVGLCACCPEKLTPYVEPYPPEEQLRSGCKATIAEMKKDGEL